jgi:Protein of unknown function (DUF3768)
MSAQSAAQKRDRIRELNDAFRRDFVGGEVLLTPGVNNLPSDVRAKAIRNVSTFADFNDGNDPHGGRDFGAFDLVGQKLFWKIDYYGLTLDKGSENPSDPAVTTRVLTLMLAEEY